MFGNVERLNPGSESYFFSQTELDLLSAQEQQNYKHQVV